MIGTAFFTLMPFVYQFINTPEQLVIVRIIHGLATAIYGPVTLAYVAEQFSQRRAERLGWFGMARSASYVVGPAVAGWLLLYLEPATIFTLIGLVSSLAFLPICLLSESSRPIEQQQRCTIKQQIDKLFTIFSSSAPIWLSGGIEATMYVASYAVKAFLPIYVLSIGGNIALVGSFFALQETIHMLFKPVGGRLGDWLGNRLTIGIGMLGLSLALSLLSFAHDSLLLIISAILIGFSQALISPTIVAFVSLQVDPDYMGTSMGTLGTIKNAGKVIGPILAGVLLQWLDFSVTFRLLSGMILGGIIFTWVYPFLFQYKVQPHCLALKAEIPRFLSKSNEEKSFLKVVAANTKSNSSNCTLGKSFKD
ncbi:MAG: MFS transporter [Leptolyngbya sp. SIO3F4]|nr:MFS transporter [Leptolyngbya sp. SIO3F4]